MASATGAPQAHPDEVARAAEGLAEDSPLLGRRGAASQAEGDSLGWNLLIGTAPIAQAGLLLLLIYIFVIMFTHPLIFFSAHPLLNISAVFLLGQAVLILQPTHTPTQKIRGTHFHAALLGAAALLFAAAFIIIEVNKFDHGFAHFTSAHGRLGLASYIALALQSAVGVSQYFVPRVWGGVANAKKVYRWHRVAGYALVVLLLGTVYAAAVTETGGKVLGIKGWVVGIGAALVVVGAAARIRRSKFGGWFGGAH